MIEFFRPNSGTNSYTDSVIKRAGWSWLFLDYINLLKKRALYKNTGNL